MTFKQLETFLNTTKTAHEGEASFLLACDNLLKLAEQGKRDKTPLFLNYIDEKDCDSFSTALDQLRATKREGEWSWNDAKKIEHICSPFYQLDTTPDDVEGFSKATDEILLALAPYREKESSLFYINIYVSQLKTMIEDNERDKADLQEFRDAIASGEVQPFKGWKSNQRHKDGTEGGFSYNMDSSEDYIFITFYKPNKRGFDYQRTKRNQIAFSIKLPHNNEGLLAVIDHMLLAQNKGIDKLKSDITYIKNNYIKIEKTARTLQALFSKIKNRTIRERIYKGLTLDKTPLTSTMED